MRLIDAEKMKTKIHLENMEAMEAGIKAWIDRQETVDAVEVVRCKDCKHFYKYLSEEKADGVCWHNNSDFEVTYNHFCSWGERREDGQTDNC